LKRSNLGFRLQLPPKNCIRFANKNVPLFSPSPKRPFVKDRQRHREHHPLQGLRPGTQQTSFNEESSARATFLKKTHPAALVLFLSANCVSKCVDTVYTYYIPQCLSLYTHIVSLVGIVFRSKWSRTKKNASWKLRSSDSAVLEEGPPSVARKPKYATRAPQF